MKHFQKETLIKKTGKLPHFIIKLTKKLRDYLIFNYNVVKVLAFFISMYSFELVNAQSQQLFSIKSTNDLNPQQLQQVSDILSKSNYTYYYIVEFNSNLIMQPMPLQFRIPNIDPDYTNIEFKTRRQNIESNIRNMYYGTLDSDSECVCTEGDIIIGQDETGSYGHISLEGKWYVIYGLGSYSFIGLQTPIVDPNFSECGTLNSPPSQIKRKKLIGKSEAIKMSHMIMPGSPCEISILFLFTAKSGKFGNDDRQDCKRIVDEINLILANSEIDNVKVAFAGIEEIPSNIYTEPTAEDLNHVIDWALTSSWFQSKRGFHGADIVMIMSEVEINMVAGISNAQQGNPNPTKEAGIIALDRSSNGFGNYTPAHELGHSIGCRHQTCNVDPYTCDNNDPYIHPHTFGVRKCWLCSWKNKMTLMHPHTNTTILNDIKRIGYFSNPDVHLEGTNDPATGIVDQRDNSRWIKDVACNIANFENGLAHLSTSISGKSSICYLYTTNLQVKVTGSNNYTVQYWEEIYNGTSKIFPGNNLSHTFNQAPDNYLPGSSVQVQVNVLIDNAYNFLSKFTISIKGNCQLGDPGNGNLKKMDNLQANASLPIQDLINEIIQNKEEVGITIYNLSMQQIIQQEKLKDSNEVYEIISSLPKGIYICIIKSNNSHYARKIFIP